MSKFRWWIVIVLVFTSLAIAALPSGGSSSRTPEERVSHLAKQIRCPTCAGLSVEQSDAPLARSSKDEIRTRVREGQSDEQIRGFFVSRYGETALMSPKRSGINSLPWILPVLLALGAVAVLLLSVRRWRNRDVVDLTSPTVEDRALVDAALRARS